MSKRVLVVDDEVEICAIFKDFLEMSDYEVLSANSCKEALEVVSKNPPFDLIISDVKMPGGDGFELLKNLNKQKVLEKSLFILMTGSIDIDQDHGKSLGVTEFLFKPVDMMKAVETINSLF